MHPTHSSAMEPELPDVAIIFYRCEHFRLTVYDIDVDTSVLGIGERNGICPLGALVRSTFTLTVRQSSNLTKIIDG